MKFIADLHIHSHFSRATSKDLVPGSICLWAKKKGIKVVGTGDFTHPGWCKELKENLVEAEEGLYRLRPDLDKQIKEKVPKACQSQTRFILSGEISCIYKKNGKTRKIHHLILMPDFDSVDCLNTRLGKIGNILSDGRPILGLDSRDLLEIVLESDERAFFIPAHIWTPWFSLFGSKSGFDSLEECFEDLSNHIRALETGLSSDPPMNRRLSALDSYLLVSNSDAHSPAKLGREANIFDTELDYPHIIGAMTNGEGFLGTIEFFPEEGKYHLDGHRKCGIRFEPRETIAHEGICPECGKPITVGVLYRVEELADRDKPVLSKDFVSLIPLTEILSEILECGPGTKKVTSVYESLLNELGPELGILMDIPLDAIEEKGGLLLSEAVRRMRDNKVIRQEGFDGQYGIIRLFNEHEKASLAGQNSLFQKDLTRTPAPRKRSGKKGASRLEKSPHSSHVEEKVVKHEDPILSPLNKAQLEAVNCGKGHVLVVAGPGTGKTLTLTHRVAYLIRSGMASPDQILALTFTRKAAREMADRIGALIGKKKDTGVCVSTFHAFCLDVLQNEAEACGLSRPIMVCPEIDSERIAREIISSTGEKRISLGSFFRELFKFRMQPLLPSGNEQEMKYGQALFQEYQLRLRELGLLDMDELLVETLKLFSNHPDICSKYASRYPWIFVDEYQDTNQAQVMLIKLLVKGGAGSVFAIGDPDQAIYGFRGAEVGNFYNFEADFPGASRITLSINYRSTQNILDAAAGVMGSKKPLISEAGKGPPLFYAPCRTDSEEAEMIVEAIERFMGGVSYFSLDSGRVESHEEELSLTFGDFAVLFRLNSQGDALEEALARRGIPFVRSGQISLIHQFPGDVIWRFMQHILDPDNAYYRKAYEETLEVHQLQGPDEIKIKAGVQSQPYEIMEQAIKIHNLGELEDYERAVVDRFLEMAGEFRGTLAEFLSYLSLERGIDNQNLIGDRVALMSLHAAKGLQWPVVFITGCEDRLIPFTMFGQKDQDEERRLFYVGITRAQKRLVLSWTKKRALNGRVIEMYPSPFLNKIPDMLIEKLPRKGWRPKPKAHKQLDLFSA